MIAPALGGGGMVTVAKGTAGIEFFGSGDGIGGPFGALAFPFALAGGAALAGRTLGALPGGTRRAISPGESDEGRHRDTEQTVE